VSHADVAHANNVDADQSGQREAVLIDHKSTGQPLAAPAFF